MLNFLIDTSVNSNKLEQRDYTLDALKGVGIILMIIGHVPSPIRNLIFSFHMPLFFFISGYLYKDRLAYDIIVRNTKKVLLPYLITCLFLWLFFIIKNNNWQWGLSIFLANGTDAVWNMSGLMVGPLWFLPCYFVATLGFHYVLKIKEKYIQVIILLLFWIAAFFIKRFFGLQPMGILNSVPAMCCMLMGYSVNDDIIKQYVFSRPAIVLGFFIWIICLVYGKVSMAGLTYKLWIFQLIGAFYLVYILFKLLKALKQNWGGQILAQIGKLSMVILCVHSVDYMLNISSSIVLLGNLPSAIGTLLNMTLKILIAITGVIIIKQSPLLRKIFAIK